MMEYVVTSQKGNHKTDHEEMTRDRGWQVVPQMKDVNGMKMGFEGGQGSED
jgi:hypothetical protein